MKWWLGIYVFLCLLGDGYAVEEQANFNWLKTIAFAGHQTEYSGVFVYQYGNRLETSRITHFVELDSEYEKVESLDEPSREIVKHHGQVWSYLNHKMVRVDSQGHNSFPSLLSDQLTTLNSNYEIKDLGLASVVGYPTQVLLFQPKDNLRYAQKIWVNTDSGLLLKAAVLNDKKQIVEQHAFTQLKIGNVSDRSIIVANTPATKIGITPAKVGSNSSTVFNSGWVVDAIPLGFKKLTEVERPMRGKHAPVTQIVFSDGLSAIFCVY